MSKKLEVYVVHLVVILVLVIMLFPVYWLISSSFKTYAGLYSLSPSIIPKEISLDFYRATFSELDIGRFLFNSLYLALLTGIITTFVGSLAAFSTIAYRYRGRLFFAQFVLFLYMFPPILAVIPLYVLLTRVRLINTHPGLLLLYVAFNAPVVIWVLRSYFVGIPHELVDAGLVDGLSKIGVLFRIIYPVAMPGIAAVIILAFIGAWSEFLFANTFIVSEELKTMPVIVVQYSFQDNISWGQILASSTLLIIPSFFFATFAQRYLVSGLSAGAVKG